MSNTTHRIKILIEALPYIQKFNHKLIIIKYGGNAMTDDAAKFSFARDVVLLKQVGLRPIVIHGGGPHISENLKRKNIRTEFIHGIRVTDEATMTVVAETLQTINAELAAAIGQSGGKVSTFCDAGASVLHAHKMYLPDSDADLGQVGIVDAIDERLIAAANDKECIPLIAPVGKTADGVTMNINADLAAAGIARDLRAEKLIFMTSARGVLDADNALLTTLTPEQTKQLIEDRVIQAGMLPKVRCAFDAVTHGVHAAHIIDGRVEHALLLELLTDEGVGTLITA